MAALAKELGAVPVVVGASNSEGGALSQSYAWQQLVNKVSTWRRCLRAVSVRS